MASQDIKIKRFIELSRNSFYEDNINETELKEIFKKNKINLNEINYSNFDVLLFAIYDDLSLNYIEFLFK